jgi:8-oxo-dGTP pyrophosphatase MutT (NUDIX family)
MLFKMLLSEIFHKIKKTIPDNLPGFDAQVKMSPPFRGKFTLESVFDNNPKHSAVLILLYPKQNEPHLVFIERINNGRAHSGQIAFPGGRVEETDESYLETALREAEEEVGADRNAIEIAGQLSWLYVPVSNFIIYPVVGVCKSDLCFVPQFSEVKSIIEVPLSKFLSKEVVTQITIENNNPYYKMDVPAYDIGNHKIWGATAMIMSEFLTILKR